MNVTYFWDVKEIWENLFHVNAMHLDRSSLWYFKILLDSFFETLGFGHIRENFL